MSSKRSARPTSCNRSVVRRRANASSRDEEQGERAGHPISTYPGHLDRHRPSERAEKTPEKCNLLYAARDFFSLCDVSCVCAPLDVIQVCFVPRCSGIALRMTYRYIQVQSSSKKKTQPRDRLVPSVLYIQEIARYVAIFL